MENSKYKIALCQLDSQADKAANLEKISELTDKAAGMGAQVVCFPENVVYGGEDKKAAAEMIPGATSVFMGALAKKYGIWIMTGSIQEIVENADAAESASGSKEIMANEDAAESASGNKESVDNADTAENTAESDEAAPAQNEGKKIRNTLMLINPYGEIVCKYSKLHMYDVEVENGPSYKESDDITPGENIVLVDTPFGRWGFAICYDIRFPELFRIMAVNGAELIFTPASFSAETGVCHWETILRTRAIENSLYIAAPDQIGQKPKTTAYGHSLIIDPWGNVIADAGTDENVIIAEIDREYLQSVRKQLPSLSNRREDIYG